MCLYYTTNVLFIMDIQISPITTHRSFIKHSLVLNLFNTFAFERLRLDKINELFCHRNASNLTQENFPRLSRIIPYSYGCFTLFYFFNSRHKKLTIKIFNELIIIEYNKQ